MAQQQLKDSFLDLERHRQLLEQNIEKLRKSLQHWQTWSAEYEGLKEEVLALGKASAADLLRLKETYEADLVTATEISDILGVSASSSVPRSAEQVLNVLDRRLDYVTQNIKTVEKQLETAETKLEKAAVVGRPEVRNEEGLPLMEIFEELDEEGNVIEGRVEAHGSNKGSLEELLRKAGVSDTRSSAKTVPSASKESEEGSEKTQHGQEVNAVAKKAPIPPTPSKKSVTFTEDLEETTPIKPDQKAIKEAQKEAKRLEEVMERAADLNKPIADPVIPADESPEDAKLRQEMLSYGMSEVGAVVAELDFEEDSDFTDEGYDDEDEDAESLEEEDAFGRSTRPVISNDLRAEMRALEDKLGVRMMQNVGSNPDLDPEILESQDLQVTDPVKPTSRKESTPPSSAIETTKSAGAPKKGVRFAEELDISEPPEPLTSKAPVVATQVPSRMKAPVSDIVERAPVLSDKSATNSAEPPKKSSRFKASRPGPASAPFTPTPKYAPPSRTRTVPTGPIGQTLASTIVEKPTPSADAVPEPDMHDPALLQQEVATEYYKKRNLMVQRQGGFRDLDDEEEKRTGIIPFTEEEGGKKKVSRFMAARLARS